MRIVDERALSLLAGGMEDGGEHSTPYFAELNMLELAIVRHSAVLALTRSPLKDQFDLDEILEMVETKKSGFWGKLFKGDKKKVKKGVFTCGCGISIGH